MKTKKLSKVAALELELQTLKRELSHAQRGKENAERRLNMESRRGEFRAKMQVDMIKARRLNTAATILAGLVQQSRSPYGPDQSRNFQDALRLADQLLEATEIVPSAHRPSSAPLWND